MFVNNIENSLDPQDRIRVSHDDRIIKAIVFGFQIF